MSRRASDHTLRPAVLAAILALVASGCGPAGGDDASPAPTDAVTTTPGGVTSGTIHPAIPYAERDFRVGVAGLVPEGFPDPTPDEFREFLGEVGEMGDYVGVYAAWDTEDLFRQIDLILAEAPGADPLVGIGFDHDAVGEGYFVENREAIVSTLVEVAERFDLEYLAVGGEVNRLHADHGEAVWEEWVETYRQAYDALDAADPDLAVYTVFQLEYLAGTTALTGMEIAPQWELLDDLEGRLDLLGLTVYPWIGYPEVAAVPPEHYSQVADHYPGPLAITEAGWPSGDVAGIVTGTEEAQVAFAGQMLEAFSAMDVEIVMWSFLNELPPGFEPFDSIALKRSDGTPKAVYEVWRSLAALPEAGS